MSAPDATGARPSLLWLQGLVCGGVATLATPTAILAGILLAPAIVAILFDREPGRPTARAVPLFGLAGFVHPAMALWRSGHTNDVALALGLDVRVFVIAWAAQAAGWLLCELVPLFVRLGFDGAAAARSAALRRTRARYEEEWDIPFAPTAAKE